MPQHVRGILHLCFLTHPTDSWQRTVNLVIWSARCRLEPECRGDSSQCDRRECPILSGRFSGIQRVQWPYLTKILDTSEEGFRSVVRHLTRFGTWTENPRVGGSIPPLATIKSKT